MLLHSESHDNLNISAVGQAVLTYTYTGQPSRSVVCRVTASSIAGNGAYLVYAELNDVRLSPDSSPSPNWPAKCRLARRRSAGISAYSARSVSRSKNMPRLGLDASIGGSSRSPGLPS